MLKSPSPEELQKWMEGFNHEVLLNPTARAAWAEIERAGIAFEARALLYGYAHGGEAGAEWRRQNKHIDHNVKAAQRACEVAEEHPNGPHAALFSQRAEEAMTTVAKTPWPNPYAAEKTVGQFMEARPEIRTLGPTLKIGEALRRFGTKPILAILRSDAALNGVTLGYRRLASLANCARPDTKMTPETLKTFLKLPAVQGCADGWLRAFQNRTKTNPPE